MQHVKKARDAPRLTFKDVLEPRATSNPQNIPAEGSSVLSRTRFHAPNNLARTLHISPEERFRVIQSLKHINRMPNFDGKLEFYYFDRISIDKINKFK